MLGPPHGVSPGAKQQLLLYWVLRLAESITVLSCALLLGMSPCPSGRAGCLLTGSLAIRWKCCRREKPRGCLTSGSTSGDSQARVLCPRVTAAVSYRGEVWIHPRKRNNPLRRGSEAAARGGLGRERHCLDGSPQCAPSPRCCHGGKVQKPRECPPWWPLTGRAGSFVSPGDSLRVPHQLGDVGAWQDPGLQESLWWEFGSPQSG